MLELLELRAETVAEPDGRNFVLDRLITPRFLGTIPWPRLQRFPRYLKAMQVRAERWATTRSRVAPASNRVSCP